MHYPVNVGKWQRQPQTHKQWIYKSGDKTWSQMAIDHITLELSANNIDANCLSMHYTTRGTSNISVDFGNGPVSGNTLVYYYDYEPDLKTGTLTRSNKMMHNENRYPKNYRGDTSAATPVFGAQKITDDAAMKRDYDTVFGMREVDKEVKDFWSSYPKFMIFVYTPLKDMTRKFEFEVKIGAAIQKYETDANTGKAIVYGHKLEDVEIRCPRFIKGFSKVTKDDNFVPADGSNYNATFSVI